MVRILGQECESRHRVYATINAQWFNSYKETKIKANYREVWKSATSNFRIENKKKEINF